MAAKANRQGQRNKEKYKRMPWNGNANINGNGKTQNIKKFIHNNAEIKKFECSLDMAGVRIKYANKTFAIRFVFGNILICISK